MSFGATFLTGKKINDEKDILIIYIVDVKLNEHKNEKH